MCSGRTSEQAAPTLTVSEIAEALQTHGRFLVQIDPLPHQRMVDLHWAAHQAGRLLGIKVRVFVESATADDDSRVTVTVTPRTFDRTSRT